MLKLDILRALQEVPDLDWLGEDIFRQLEPHVKIELYENRELLFEGQASSDSLLVLVNGSLQVLECSERGETLRHVLYENDVYGLNFLFERPLSYSCMVVASSKSLLLNIPTDLFRSLLLQSPKDAASYEKYKNKYDTYRFLKNATSFGDHLSSQELLELSQAFELRTYQDGNGVFSQGDVPDGYYILNLGQLKVIVTKDEVEVFSTRLKPGDYFGELAMINASNRSASIVSLGESQCFFLSLSIFEDLVKRQPQLMKGFKQLASLAYG